MVESLTDTIERRDLLLRATDELRALYTGYATAERVAAHVTRALTTGTSPRVMTRETAGRTADAG
jgi:hypothetical protein